MKRMQNRIRIGVQNINIIDDADPLTGFKRIKACGFDCCDFGLNKYLINKDLYSYAGGKCITKDDIHSFYDKTEEELENYFFTHREVAARSGITINQCHMPYPVFVPGADRAVNEYLAENVAVKSMHVAAFLGCPNIVIHGFKLAKYTGCEQTEWDATEKFLDSLAPYAIDHGITMCIENLYTSAGPGHIVGGPGCDAYKAAERIDRMNERYGAEVMGFCLDTGHANLTGLDIESFINILGKRIKVLHIHDNDGVSDLHQVPFTFTKERYGLPGLDWEGFIRGMASISFDGVLSFETAPVLKSFPSELHDDVLRLIAAEGRYLSKRIDEESCI